MGEIECEERNRVTNAMKNDTCKTRVCWGLDVAKKVWQSHGKWMLLGGNVKIGKHKVNPGWNIQFLAIFQLINIRAVKLQIMSINPVCIQKLTLGWSRVPINLTSFHIYGSLPLLNCHWENLLMPYSQHPDCLVSLVFKDY